MMHIVFWFFFFLAAFTIDSYTDPGATLIKELIFFVTQNLFLFYGFYYALKKFSLSSKPGFFISVGRFVLVACSFIALRYFVRYYFLATFFDIAYAQFPVRKWFPTCFIWIINSFFYALAYFYFQISIKKQKELRLKEQKQLKTEREMLALENERLRAQINPHFLFNTLSYFYSSVSAQQPEVAEGIASLADIMRASIRKPDKDGLIFLEEEITNIEQLINIYRLRYNNTVHIAFTRDGHCRGLRILPHILTTLVENGLKHGELRSATHPLTVKVGLKDEILQFVLFNKKRDGPKEPSHGIGMDYLNTHLRSIYESRYTLAINEDENFYQVTLEICLAITHSENLMKTENHLM